MEPREIDKGITLLTDACDTVIRDIQKDTVFGDAIAAADAGDTHAAMARAQEALSRNPVHPHACLLLGDLLLHSVSDRTGAMKYFSKAIAHNPGHSLALWYMAMENLRAGKIAKALALFSEASEAEPVDAYAAVTQAWVLSMLGTCNEAASKITNGLVNDHLMCEALARIIGSQEQRFNSNARGSLFGRYASCLIDFASSMPRQGNDQQMLSTLVQRSAGDLRVTHGPEENRPECIHLTNPSLALYRSQLGQSVVEHYAVSFLRAVLLPEIIRVVQSSGIEARPRVGKPERIPPDMVLIPAGTYITGSDTGTDAPSERTWATRGFLIDRYPVTRGQWKAFDPTYTCPKNCQNHPMTGINFIQATLYARGRGKRLPQKLNGRLLPVDPAVSNSRGVMSPILAVPTVLRARRDPLLP